MPQQNARPVEDSPWRARTRMRLLALVRPAREFGRCPVRVFANSRTIREYSRAPIDGNRAPSIFSFTNSFSSASAPVQSSQGVRSFSYLKRGIERCYLGLTKRHRERVLELCWHTIS